MPEYLAYVEWKNEFGGALKCGNGHSTFFSSPPEFGGKKGIFTPEDAFVASVNMCIQMTFLKIATRARLNLLQYECEAKGETVSEIGNIYHFSNVTLRPKIVVKDSSEEKVLRLLKIAEKNCIISNSVKCTVEVQPEIVLK